MIARWWKIIAAALGAAGLVFAANRASNLRARAVRAEAEADDILGDDTAVFIDHADRLLRDAENDKVRARAIVMDMENSLEKLAANDATLDDLAHHFNSRRLRTGSSQAPRLEPGSPTGGSA